MRGIAGQVRKAELSYSFPASRGTCYLYWVKKWGHEVEVLYQTVAKWGSTGCANATRRDGTGVRGYG